MSALAADDTFMPDNKLTGKPLPKSESERKIVQQLYDYWKECEQDIVLAKEKARKAEKLYREAAGLPSGFPNITGMTPVDATVAILTHRGEWIKKSELIGLLDERWRNRRGGLGNFDRSMKLTDRVIQKPNPHDKDDPLLGLPEWKK